MLLGTCRGHIVDLQFSQVSAVFPRNRPQQHGNPPRISCRRATNWQVGAGSGRRRHSSWRYGGHTGQWGQMHVIFWVDGEAELMLLAAFGHVTAYL
jgi:hypothetical protein